MKSLHEIAPNRFPGLALGPIVLVYLTIGVQYAVLTPAWQTPDEPAHYNVIRQIAQTGALPRLEPGDYDQAYLSRLVSERFPPDLSVDRVQYQDYQPPLYYLLATPVFLIANGSLIALRLLSLALGAGVVVLTFLTTQELAGPASALPALAAGFVAFIPQHIAMLAGANNDSLAELVIALGLWLVLRQNRLGLQPWVLGLILGAAFVTKVQAYVLAPVMAGMLLVRWRRAGWDEWRPVARSALIVFGVGLSFGALYWGRNWFVCGPLDLVCGNWHSQVVVGQPTTQDWIRQYGWWGSEASLINRFFAFTFQSFWGQFGWMAVVMDRRVYLALLALSAGLGIGAVGAARGWRTLSPAARDGTLLLGLSALVSVALYLYYNLEFVQHQGRYLFPALVPLGAAAAAGLCQWARWAAAWFERAPDASRFTPYLRLSIAGAPIGLLAVLSLFALYRFVLPTLQG